MTPLEALPPPTPAVEPGLAEVLGVGVENGGERVPLGVPLGEGKAKELHPLAQRG